jgi:hypothetical protein
MQAAMGNNFRWALPETATSTHLPNLKGPFSSILSFDHATKQNLAHMQAASMVHTGTLKRGLRDLAGSKTAQRSLLTLIPIGPNWNLKPSSIPREPSIWLGLKLFSSLAMLATWQESILEKRGSTRLTWV